MSRRRGVERKLWIPVLLCPLYKALCGPNHGGKPRIGISPNRPSFLFIANVAIVFRRVLRLGVCLLSGDTHNMVAEPHADSQLINFAD